MSGQARAASASPFIQGRVLLVDDDLLVRTTMETGLRRKGYDVLTAHSATEAWQMVQRQPRDFEVLITDQTMPGTTGLELGERVAELCPTCPGC